MQKINPQRPASNGRKPVGEEAKRGEEYLTMFQTFKAHPCYDLFMQWVDEKTRATFQNLMAEKDPTQLAKDVGAIAAFKEVRARIDFEISATLSYLKGDVEEK